MPTITRLTDRAKRMMRTLDITRELGDPETSTSRGWLTRIEDFIDALSAGTGMTPGFLSADAFGRSLMAAGYFGAGVAASAAHFTNGFWTNAIVAKFADSLFAADAASRAKFVDGIWNEPKIGDDVKLNRARLTMDDTAPSTTRGRGVVFGTGAEGAVSALAAPAMAVRVPTGGFGASSRGRVAAIPTSANLAISASDPANPRWDIVVCTDLATGVLTVREGTAGAVPADPALTAGDIVLARVVVPAAAAAIGGGGGGWIEDLRCRRGLLDLATAGESIGLPGASADISGVGANADLQVNVNGGGATALTIPDPSAFSIGGAAAVALDTPARIVAALNQLAQQAGLACQFAVDQPTPMSPARYYCTTTLRGAGRSVVVTAGAVNNIADNLMIGTAAGGEEHQGQGTLDAVVELLRANPAPRSVDGAALATGALAATADGLTKMADGYLSADAGGLAKMAAGYLQASVDGLAKMAAGYLAASANGRAKFADAFWTAAEVIGAGAGVKFAVGAKPAVHIGAPQQNRLNLAAFPANGDWISVTGADGVVVPLEFRDSSPPVGGTAGRIWVYRGAALPADSRVNLVDALNGVVDPNRISYDEAGGGAAIAPPVGFTGVDVVADTAVLYVEDVPSETVRAVTENLTDAGDIWDAAATYGGLLETRQRHGWQQFAINADQITAGQAFFCFSFTPLRAIVINHARPQNEAWAIVGNTVRLTLAGGAAPNNQAGDVVSVIAFG